MPRVGWPPHGRAPTAIRASATGGSDGIDTPDEPVFLGKKGRMAKMVDMSQSSGESDALQGVQVFLVEFGLIAMGVVDTLMVGHVGEAALAAACLGGTTTWLVMITAIGLLGALDPLTSQAFGAEDDAAVKRHLRSGLYASVALNAGCMLILTMAVAPLYAVCGQPSLLAAAASHYCHIEAWGILPVLLFQAIRLSLMSTNVFRPLVVAITIANATNVALNQVLINGMTVAGGITIPAFGLTGAAWATVTSRWILLTLTCAFAYEELKSRDAFKPIRESVSSALERAGGIVKRSLPIGGQMLMEFGAFAALTLIAGRCGTTQAAGHAIVQCLTDMSYVLPLGIGALGSIKVGQGVGGGDGGEAQRAARMSMLRGVYGVAINAFIYVVFGEFLFTFVWAIRLTSCFVYREANLLVVHFGSRGARGGGEHPAGGRGVPGGGRCTRGERGVPARGWTAEHRASQRRGRFLGLGDTGWVLPGGADGDERDGDMARVRVRGDGGDDADMYQGVERREQGGEAAGRPRVMTTRLS